MDGANEPKSVSKDMPQKELSNAERKEDKVKTCDMFSNYTKNKIIGVKLGCVKSSPSPLMSLPPKSIILISND